VPEAHLEDFGSGLSPVTQGWFVVNVRNAEWWNSARRGARCAFDNEYGDPPVEFAQLGINLTVFEPGETGLYHAEENQEAFLVLSGECALLVMGEERRLRPWDFFHSPPWTEHAFVGAGEEPCVILMLGSRSGPGVHYPVSELAARYGASVAEETSDWRQAYATVEPFRRERAAELDSFALGLDSFGGHSGTLAQASGSSPGSRFIRRGRPSLSGVAPSIGPA
jgi:quercetin dioxygenase-like cupin family protein